MYDKIHIFFSVAPLPMLFILLNPLFQGCASSGRYGRYHQSQAMTSIESIAEGLRLCSAYQIPDEGNANTKSTDIRAIKPWIYCLEDLNQMTIKKEFMDSDTFLHQGAVALLKSLTKRYDFAYDDKQKSISLKEWNQTMAKIFHWLQWPTKENAPWREPISAAIIRGELPEFADFAMTPDLPRSKALDPYSTDLDLLDEMTEQQTVSSEKTTPPSFKDTKNQEPNWCKAYMKYLNELLRYEAQLNWQKNAPSSTLPGPRQFSQSLTEKRKCLHLRMH